VLKNRQAVGQQARLFKPLLVFHQAADHSPVLDSLLVNLEVRAPLANCLVKHARQLFNRSGCGNVCIKVDPFPGDFPHAGRLDPFGIQLGRPLTLAAAELNR
jgi:hypothetical protein